MDTSVSGTQFTLFRATKACQTDVQEVNDTKDLSMQINSLLREIKESTDCIQYAYEDQASRLFIRIVEKLENKKEELKKLYRIALERVERCSRTELANAIAILWRQYESKYDNAVQKIRKNHVAEVQSLETKIAIYKRKKLSNDSNISKNNKLIEKWIKLVKKKGYDLLALFNEDKVALSQMELLDNLQKSMIAKENQLSQLRLLYEQEIQKSENRKKMEAEKFLNAKQMKKMARKGLMNQRGSVAPSSLNSFVGNALSALSSNDTNSLIDLPVIESSKMEPDGTIENENDEKDLEESVDFENFDISEYSFNKNVNIEEMLASMEKEFEKEKEEELNVTQQLEEEFKNNYELIKSKAINSKANNPIILKHSKDLFKMTSALFSPTTIDA